MREFKIKKIIISLIIVNLILISGCKKDTSKPLYNKITNIEVNGKQVEWKETIDYSAFYPSDISSDFYDITYNEIALNKGTKGYVVTKVKKNCRTSLEYIWSLHINVGQEVIITNTNTLHIQKYEDELGYYWRICDNTDDSVWILILNEDYYNAYLEVSQ